MRPSLEHSLQIQRSLGIGAELLEPGELGRIEPRIDASGLGALLYEPDSGYADPTGVTLGYAAAARDLGIIIEQAAPVTAIRVEGEKVAGVVAAKGERIDSRCVVNTAGLWASSVAALAGVSLPIVVGRHPVFVVRRGPGFGGSHPVYLDLAGGTYLKPDTGDLTLTGSLTEDETRHPMEPELLGNAVGLDEAGPALEGASRALPLLADCQYQRGWAGAYDITPDWMPILDESPVEGFYIAAGMSGHGFKLAPAVGELMAALITEGRTDFNRDLFRLDRFAARVSAGSFVSSYLTV